MLMLGSAVLGLAGGLLSGGRIWSVLTTKIRWPLIVIAALAMRLIVISPKVTQSQTVDWIYAASLFLLVLWTAVNARTMPGVWIAGIGILLNAVVIAANGAHMPVATPSLGPGPLIGPYVAIGPDTRLAPIADWIPLPPKGYPIYSPGDLVTAGGILVTGFFLVRRPAPYSGLNLS